VSSATTLDEQIAAVRTAINHQKAMAAGEFYCPKQALEWVNFVVHLQAALATLESLKPISAQENGHPHPTSPRPHRRALRRRDGPDAR
jgi:hypothetical protein